MSREGRRRWSINERFVIGQPGNPMMQRWRLLQTPWLGLYVHFIYREDLDATLHDHPWHFWTFVLRGGYKEHFVANPRTDWTDMQDRSWRRWSLHSMPPSVAHYTTHVQHKTTTLLIVGPKRQVWGFYELPDDVDKPAHWVDYRDALGLRPMEGDPAKRPILRSVQGDETSG